MSSNRSQSRLSKATTIEPMAIYSVSNWHLAKNYLHYFWHENDFDDGLDELNDGDGGGCGLIGDDVSQGPHCSLAFC